MALAPRLITVAFGVLLSFHALACTLSVGQSVRDSFRDAQNVVLAEVEAGSRAAASTDPSRPGPIEAVTYRVLLSWKGRFAPGARVRTVTDLSPGSCGLSVDPSYRLLVEKPPVEVPSGGIWVLFLGSGAAPLSLDATLGSRRVGAGGELYMRELFDLSRSSSNQAKP